MGISVGAWLLCRLEVTKVQLPHLYRGDLDKLPACATLVLGAALGDCQETRPHPPQGAVQGSLTIVTIGLWLENRVAAQYQLNNRVFRPFAQESHEKGKSLA